METVADYLVANGESWLQYCVKVQLLHENKSMLELLKAKALQDDKIKLYLADVADFHSELVRNHKNPDLPIHKLMFLLDIGFDMSVPEIETAVRSIMKHKDSNGVYQSLTNIPKHFGGTGEDGFGWCLCDSPLMLLALLKAGVDYEKHLKQGVDYLVSLYQPQGFPCSVSVEFGKFRGPGRKDDCCPYATLIMLKLLGEIPEYENSKITRDSIDVLLSLWENSLEKHPYMFYMGTDFRKLKAPAMWYDIVGVSDCLSKFAYAKKDARFKGMVRIMEEKQDANGLFTPESVYLKCKGWDFGQKKTPSLYLTFLCVRILERMKNQKE